MTCILNYIVQCPKTTCMIYYVSLAVNSSMVYKLHQTKTKAIGLDGSAKIYDVIMNYEHNNDVND